MSLKTKKNKMNVMTKECDYTDALENSNIGLRKRTRTPLMAPIPAPVNITKVVDNTLNLEERFKQFRNSIKSIAPSAQFDKIFVEKELEAECVVSGIFGNLAAMQELEDERFKFFLEDGRLIVRYVGEPVKVQTTSKLKLVFILLWVIAFILTGYFMFLNMEKYKQFLK